MENFRLKVFRSVCDHLSFRRAAEELHLSQPAITQQIKALEEELSTRLLDRTGGRIVLTPAGRILKKRAAELAELVALTQEELASLNGEHSGLLRAGAIHQHCAIRAAEDARILQTGASPGKVADQQREY